MEIFSSAWFLPVQRPREQPSSGNIILPTQGNYLCCRSLRAEICSIEDSNTFSERLPGNRSTSISDTLFIELEFSLTSCHIMFSLVQHLTGSDNRLGGLKMPKRKA
ncbi:hypothetical protein QYE76_045620 [Lolium multiflorum]|uniref:Uncharacterized protein n=1 Tax=Lolium multiflorum TaxID=4521 RepID=A0AAD8TNA8_LOLMU|nr:hypothetical protein QYE76_045620 [Lolium multiflorum]